MSFQSVESVYTELDTPAKFEFPFAPYQIQHDFMKTLYETIERRRCGIFESPTGTGKSLSIVCGALRWLKDHNANERSCLDKEIERLEHLKDSVTVNNADWISSQTREIEINRKLQTVKAEKAKIDGYEARLGRLRVKKKFGSKQVEVEVKEEDREGLEEDDVILEEAVVMPDEESSEEDEDKYEPVKILICSRTHSQLSQLVGEIVKSPYGQNTRTISLASRQNYCVNPAVASLKNVTLINERCLDLQSKTPKATQIDSAGKVLKKPKGAAKKDCPYNRQQNVHDLSEVALTEILDVEDLVTKGKQMKACPYYAARKAAEDAQIVLVPYNTLLHHTTRQANGLKLQNNVVIIDEAHNLLEALAQMYSAEITLDQLDEIRKRLTSYKSKYSTRFSAQNLLRLNQMIFVVKMLLDVFSCEQTGTEICTVQEFVLKAKIDNYNMFSLVKFCRETKLAQKVHNFALRHPNDLQPQETTKTSSRDGLKKFLSSIENHKTQPAEETPAEKKTITPSNPLLPCVNFLEALTYTYEDGRIILESRSLRFLLLNPAAQFDRVVKTARSVIVAGGTMKPLTEFRRLFTSTGLTPSNIVEFSCGHVIPEGNILPLVIPTGFNRENLVFNFENKFNMSASVKTVLQELAKRVRGGIVVFFPSYKYEAWIWQEIKYANFNNRALFREPQNTGSVESVLSAYAKAIQRPNSAMLFSVVGGKLSEGLNFSDDLGRCVVVVGLPYANIYSAELKEKMRYLDKCEGNGSGQRFYESLCMKSVNQCIGRAVRHQNDYACVVLLDSRYSRPSTKNSLPDWIKRSLKVADFKDALTSIEQFFVLHESPR